MGVGQQIFNSLHAFIKTETTGIVLVIALAAVLAGLFAVARGGGFEGAIFAFGSTLIGAAVLVFILYNLPTIIPKVLPTSALPLPERAAPGLASTWSTRPPACAP